MQQHTSISSKQEAATAAADKLQGSRTEATQEQHKNSRPAADQQQHINTRTPPTAHQQQKQQQQLFWVALQAIAIRFEAIVSRLDAIAS